MILFEKVRWKNFLSTGNQYTEIDFTINKTNLIIGSNGAGKSTVLDALTFALFGKPFRKINKPQLINSTNEKDCVVEVDFTIGKINWRILSLIILFIEEKILISNKSSMTSLRLVADNCIKGTKVLLPKITI